MVTTLKDLTTKLALALKALKKPELKPLIQELQSSQSKYGADIHLYLTKFIVLRVVTPHPDVMANPYNKDLNDFCLNDVKPIRAGRITLSKTEQAAVRQFMGATTTPKNRPSRKVR